MRTMFTGIDNSSTTPEQRELWAQLVEYSAPHVRDKFVDFGLATDQVGADALFLELKRFLFLTHCLEHKQMVMNSSMVDAAWHTFILHTSDYHRFCETIFKHPVEHLPRLARGNTKRIFSDMPSQDDFVQSYEARFGVVPDVWYDWRCLRSHTRLQHADIRVRMNAGIESGKAALFRHSNSVTDVVCRASAGALDALQFIADNDPFLVRELPKLTHEERILIVSPLVQYGILELAL